MALPAHKAGTYRYGDYLKWPEDERWELIDGVAYDMTPAPGRAHQQVAGALFSQLHVALRGEPCRAYIAPFDVRLPEGDEADEQVVTVVQPDVVVVCDREKLDAAGCRGAPDFVVEVLSPSTAGKDQRVKTALYERHGVKEYWVIDPLHRLLTVRLLGADGRYGPPSIQSGEGRLTLTAVPGLELDLDAVFADE